MLQVNLPEQGRIHVRTRELLRELLAPIHQAQARLLPQRANIHEPGNLVLSQEAQAPALARIALHHLRELLEERLLLVLDGLESRRVQLPDLVGRDAEDLPQGGVGSMLHMLRRVDETAELELDDVVDLLLREILDHVVNYIIAGRPPAAHNAQIRS